MKKLLALTMVMVSFMSCTKDDIITPETENTTINGSSVNGSSVKRTTSVQCSGTTKAGSRCKNKTLSANGRCYLHGGN